mgnify:CR=1 FL=1
MISVHNSMYSTASRIEWRCWHCKEARSAIQDSGYKKKVIFTGKIDNNKLYIISRLERDIRHHFVTADTCIIEFILPEQDEKYSFKIHWFRNSDVVLPYLLFVRYTHIFSVDCRDGSQECSGLFHFFHIHVFKGSLPGKLVYLFEHNKV